MWWTRFKAYAKVQKFHEALTKDQDLPDTQADAESLDRDANAKKKAVAAIDRNEKALSHLAVPFTAPKAMVHYHKASDDNWPDGLASNVVNSLLKKFRPQDIISGIKYENALQSFKFKKNQEPTDIFDHFTELNIQFGIEERDEKKLIAFALKKLPEKYVTAFSTLAASLYGNVDLDKFEETVEAIYRASQGSPKTNEDNGNDEVNISSIDGKKKGKGQNKNKTNKNKDDKNEKDKNDDDPCPHCGRTGHDPKNCWMLSSNQAKRPD